MKPSLSEIRQMPALYNASASDVGALVRQKQDVIRRQQSLITRLERELELAQMRAEYMSTLLESREQQYQALLSLLSRHAGGDGDNNEM